MRKVLLILLGIIISVALHAQEKTKQQELGLAFNSINNFGITYKIGHKKALWRFNTLMIAGNTRHESVDSISQDQLNTGFGITMGREYRHELLSNFEIRYGADLSFRYNYSRLESEGLGYERLESRSVYNPGVNIVFGFNYVVAEHLVIGAELLPSFSWEKATVKRTLPDQPDYEHQYSGYHFGLSNNSALLSIAYRF